MIIFVCLVAVAIYATHALKVSQPSTQYLTQRPPGWVTQSEDVCVAYKYSSPSVYIPPNPTLNISSAEPLQSVPTCLDPDVLASQEITQRCMSSKCINDLGQIVDNSSIQTIREVCGPTDPCVGRLSGISIIYKPSVQYCINYPKTEICDPNNVSKYRVYRLFPGQSPSSLVPGRQQPGPLMKIEDRNTGDCMTFVPTQIYHSENLTSNSYVGCGSDDRTVVRGEEGIIFDNPRSLARSGFVWYYIQYQDIYLLVFIGSADPSNIPQNSGTIDYFIDNNFGCLMSISTTTPTNLLMFPLKMLKNMSSCALSALSFQYLDIEIYNSIIRS